MKLLTLISYLLIQSSALRNQVNPPSTPGSFQSTSVGSTFIFLTWSQTPGEVVETYDIIYNFTINGCSIMGVNVSVLVNGSRRQFNMTLLQENSVHTIRITARNGGGVSAPAQAVATTHIAAASVPPRNLQVTGTTFTSITVEWEEVPCEHRNAEITHYVWRIINNNSTMRNGDLVRANTLSRHFTGLVPRNNYTIQVQARHQDYSVTQIAFLGPPASITTMAGIPPGLEFLLRGIPYSNNSVVTLSSIGRPSDSLYCLTDYTSCCREEEGGAAGEWFLPSGQTVPVGSVGTDFTSTRAPSAVLLTRLTTTGPSGVYTCQIPDTSGQLRTLYVGVDLAGALSILDLEYNRTSLTLTCTSRGRPVHSITWLKDNTVVGTEFSQGQTITDAVSATYQHTLRGDDIAALVGSFTCRVGDAEDNIVSRTLKLNGVDLDETNTVVGGVAMVTCSSDEGVADRIEIVSSTGLMTSQMSVQTLTLAIDLVTDTLHNSNITCFVTRGLGTTSETRDNQTIIITVEVPTDPITASVNRTGSSIAGYELSLNCIIKTIAGFANMPIAVWREHDGDAIVSGGDITIQTTQDNTVSVATLTFNPVRASHGRMYTCTGHLLTPAQPDTPLKVSRTEDLRIQISPPMVTISHIHGSLVAGSLENTTFICSALVNVSVVDRGTLLYAFEWRDRNSRTITSGGRTIISTLSQSSTLTLSPLSTADTNFTCAVTVAEAQNTLTSSNVGTNSTSINAGIPANPVVEVVSSGSLTAGNTLTLTCTVTLQQTLRVSPVIVWMGPDGTEIRNGTVENVTVSLPSPLIAELAFSPLLIRHEGIYTCMTSVESTLAAYSISSSHSTNVAVLFPPPVVTIASSPVSSDFFTGLQLTLTCSIHIPQVLHSEPLEVSAQWSRDGTPLTSSAHVTVGEEPVRVGPLLYESTVVFGSLDGSRDNGGYTCFAKINSSDTATSAFTITVQVTFFQLKLSGVNDCQSWRLENSPAKDRDLEDIIVENVASRCGCGFKEDRITDRVFQCFSSSPQSVTYHAQLHGTLDANISQLISHIEEWVSSGLTIPVQFLPLTVTSVCAVNSSTALEHCPGETTDPPTSDSSASDTTSIIIYASVAAIIAIVVTMVFLIAILYMRHKRSTSSSKTINKRLPTRPAIEMDSLQPDQVHEYEDLEKFSATILPATTSEGEYEVVKCDKAPGPAGKTTDADYDIAECTVATGLAGKITDRESDYDTVERTEATEQEGKIANSESDYKTVKSNDAHYDTVKSTKQITERHTADKDYNFTKCPAYLHTRPQSQPGDIHMNSQN